MISSLQIRRVTRRPYVYHAASSKEPASASSVPSPFDHRLFKMVPVPYCPFFGFAPSLTRLGPCYPPDDNKLPPPHALRRRPIFNLLPLGIQEHFFFSAAQRPTVLGTLPFSLSFGVLFFSNAPLTPSTLFPTLP